MPTRSKNGILELRNNVSMYLLPHKGYLQNPLLTVLKQLQGNQKGSGEGESPNMAETFSKSFPPWKKQKGDGPLLLQVHRKVAKQVK